MAKFIIVFNVTEAISPTGTRSAVSYGMVGKTGSRRFASQRDLNEIRYLRMKGRSMSKIAEALHVCRQTIGRWISLHDLDREMMEEECARCDLLHHFALNSDLLDDQSLPAVIRVKVSAIHARQGQMLLRLGRGSHQMTDEVSKRPIQEMSDDELHAMLVRLVFGLETKAEIGSVGSRKPGEIGTSSLHGDGETGAKASGV